MPVNSWLPLAHPVAPTNVSALLSSVIVNLGIYGIVRLNLDLASVKGSLPGLIVLGVGSLSALIGILYATVQAEMNDCWPTARSKTWGSSRRALAPP